MKKTKTTYGVYNLIEWHALLRMGKATVKVLFTGGAITTQGVTPAIFTTEDPVIQFAIERSPEFKNGKIKVVRRVGLKDVIEIERNVTKKTAHNIIPDRASASMSAECVPTSVEEDGQDHDSQAKNDSQTENNEDATPAMTQVEFSCNDDAKDYLEQTFGFVRSKLHNREDIMAAGKAHGVDIVFV